MSYRVTESPNTTWYTRRRGWYRLSTTRRREVTDVPVRYRKLRLADLPTTEAGTIVRDWCKRWGEFPESGLSLEDFEENRGRGLWLYGNPGTGKTRMLCIALNHLSDLGWCSKFVTAADLYDLSLRPMRMRDQEERAIWQGLYDCYDAGWDGWRVVGFDDLGKEHKTATKWIENQLDAILRHRFNTGAPSIIATNLTLRQIATTYNPSMRDFIDEAFIKVAVTGESHRGR